MFYLMKSCVQCGNTIPSGKLCCSCKAYIRRGGVWHPLPPYGTVVYDEMGKPICHVCGMSFDKLVEHTIRKHALDSAEYRQKFGLMLSAKLTGPLYREKMQKHAEVQQTYTQNFELTQSGVTRHTSGRTPGWSKQEKAARQRAQALNGSKSKQNLSEVQLAALGKVWAKNLPNNR